MGRWPASTDLCVADQEPKYYMCWDAPHPHIPGQAMRTAIGNGSGAELSTMRYFGTLGGRRKAGEHTVLSLPARCRRRIAEELPDAKLIVIVRDPIDRAYSNWMHLWVDGLEPISNSSTPGTPRTAG
jgi:hypothetical protein